MPGSIAETRYGRQGGGWIPPEAPKASAPAKPKGKYESTCPQCGQEYRWDPAPGRPGQPPGCGRRPCLEARWTDEEWEGRARMAAARRAAGKALDRTDRTALTRYPQP